MAVVVGRLVIAEQHPVALAVFGARCGLAYHLGAAVAVKVIYHELRIVVARAYVVPQVDAPQSGAVKSVTVYDGRAREAAP